MLEASEASTAILLASLWRRVRLKAPAFWRSIRWIVNAQAIKQSIKSCVPSPLIDILVYCIREKSSYRSAIRERVQDKIGLEIGGPSSTFSWSGALPIYRVAQRIDNAVFCGETLWASHDDTYAVSREAGRTFFREASDLHGIPDGAYDFLLASHVLEHLANPIKGLYEWRRVVKCAGTMAIVVPDRERTFDHKRPLTTIEHMFSDFERNIGEDDLTHVEEEVALHDYAMHDPCGGAEGNRARCLQNLKYRCLHHHTFSLPSLKAVLSVTGISVTFIERISPVHILAIGTLS